MIIKDLGAVSAYAYAVEKGYTGTEEEFATLMASYATVAEEAAESAESASQSAESASASAQTATSKANEASTSATQAGASATSASQSASTATAKASEASASASTAGTKASEASTSATTASTKASEASASATSAQTAQGLAESARDDAIDAKTDAETARDLAQQYAESINPEHIYSAYPTDTASGDIVTFADGADDIPMKSVKVAIEPVQSGSGDPSPDNVRPISGWTGAQVVRTGKNLFDKETAENGFIVAKTGQVQPDDKYKHSDYIYVFPDMTYSITNTGFIGANGGAYYDINKNYVREFRISSFPASFTVPSGCYYMRFSIVPIYLDTIQLELGSTATAYEPYGNTYNITFPSEAGTIYGGELDVTNGVLTVDRAMMDLGALTWNVDINIFYSLTPPLFGKGGTALASSTAKNVCENYNHGTVSINNPVNGRFSVANSQQIPILRLSDNRFNDAQSLKAALDGVKAVFELYTPITYNLTPTEIKSLLGDNHIWADAGNIEVTYRADTKLYIEKKMAGTDIPMIADSNIVSGSYFMIGDNLYKATANIASGAAVVVGTNATAKTMAEALNEINA